VIPGSVHDWDLPGPAALVSSSRTLREDSRRLLRIARASLTRATEQLLRSHELLVSLGKARRFCGGSDSDPVGDLGALCAHCGKGLYASDGIVNVGGPTRLFHRACYPETGVAMPATTGIVGAVLAVLPGEAAILDAAGTIVQTNDRWAAASRNRAMTSERPLAVGSNYLDACRRAIGIPPGEARLVLAALESLLQGGREEFVLEYPSSRQGKDCWLEMRVRRLTYPDRGAVVMHFDVTTRRQAEGAAKRYLSEIAHLDRVASLGQLASSLVHELNQPLAAILCNAQAASRMLSATPPDLTDVRECLVDIISDDQRAAEVIWRTRRLLKKTEVVRLPLALNDLVAKTVALVENDARLHGVTVTLAPATRLPDVYGDPVQIQQVILNLLTNAITAAATAPSRVRTVLVWAALAGFSVEIGVHDSGAGIPAGDMDRLFEPFFTTRDDGLGMGLAISHIIVEAHGGRLLVHNDPAGGAVFRLHLPTDRPSTA
jgi:signal transduction histidine kinase